MHPGRWHQKSNPSGDAAGAKPAWYRLACRFVRPCHEASNETAARNVATPSVEELAKRIRLGEDSALELKRIEVEGGRVRSPHRDGLADELAALANGRGGTLVLGVNDETRHVEGMTIEELDTAERWVQEICNDSIKPPLDADILKLELPRADGTPAPVLRIDVPSGLFVHESPGGYFKRSDCSKRRMAPDVLARAFHERKYNRLIYFDQSIVPRTRRSDLHHSLTERFLQSDAEPNLGDGGTTGDMLSKLGIAGGDAGMELTLAGVLMCTERPQRWLNHAYVQAVSYAGERADVDYQTDAKDIGGPLDTQVVEALHFVRRNMLVRATKETARADRPQFSERAVFEALVNAVAHRDYSMAGMRIRLHMFNDRLELLVPGALANTLTVDNLHLRQASRNELIVSLLARCPAPTGLGRSRMMDRRGDGVPIILAECRALSGRAPTYSLIDDAELHLVMWA